MIFVGAEDVYLVNVTVVMETFIGEYTAIFNRSMHSEYSEYRYSSDVVK